MQRICLFEATFHLNILHGSAWVCTQARSNNFHDCVRTAIGPIYVDLCSLGTMPIGMLSECACVHPMSSCHSATFTRRQEECTSTCATSCFSFQKLRLMEFFHSCASWQPTSLCPAQRCNSLSLACAADHNGLL